MVKKEKIKLFVKNLLEKRDFMFYMTEYLRTCSVYWSLNVYNLIMDEDKKLKKFSLEYLKKVYNEDGGFGACYNFPSSITSTFSALQAFFILEEQFYCEKTEDFLLNQFCDKGSCKVEDDNRLVCCLILSLLLLNRTKEKNKELKCFSHDYLTHLKRKGFKIEKIIEFVLKCYNFDGGFGRNELGESHTAQIFCCLSILRTFDHLHCFDHQKTIQFLIFRQNETGGLTGRPDKKEDVCYSFWTYSSLYMLGKSDLIDKTKLRSFILSCHDEGFSDRPGNEEDLFHTMFALAGLSLLNEENIKKVDPALCI